jgi:RHS repeat-associated protein
MEEKESKKNENREETGGSGGVTVPAITLPKGGGAIRGMGEKFAANPVTGTGSFSVPIAVTPGRGGFTPELSLSYDSGSGNGPFGFGWSLSMPSITRKTDKGLPRYEDANESDVFILSGAEDLVPILVQQNGEWQPEEPDPGVFEGEEYEVRHYRPRTEGLFARIERWTHKDTGIIHWRSISKENITSIYGKDDNSRIYDPDDPRRIFTWLIRESYDDKGNAILYSYVSENSTNIDLSRVHEKNRDKCRGVNRYLKRIMYGNRISRLPQPDLSKMSWLFELVLDYGEHHPGDPKPNDQGEWFRRGDPFSSYRAGFEVRTYRLCRRVLMFHHFPDELTELGREDYLVRSTEFTYNQSPIASFMDSVTQSGYVLDSEGGTYLKKSLPPLEFEYSRAEIREQVRCVDAQSMENLPNGLDGEQYKWLDLNGEGLSGILTEQADAWYYKANRGNGRFAPLQPVAVMPSTANLSGGGQQFLDLAGDGQLDYVRFSEPLPGFYERTHDEQWETFTPFESRPHIDWNDPNLKFIDLNGDGHADILISENHVFTWYPSLAEQGFGPSKEVLKVFDEEKGPALVFADGTQSVYLSDMSGDGLPDIVRIRNGEVCCWPNLGYGRFGEKVTMDNAPWFDHPDQFDRRRLHLADIDGSGSTDIIYFGRERVSLYFNESGNSWSEARHLTQFPHIDNLTSMTVVDLLGNGTACIVWSSSLPGDSRRPMRYIDLMGGGKPHLLTMVKNNMGAETRVEYAASTKFYLQDREEGNPWITRLPFPVHVVERVETYDRISKNRFVTRYAYHHGYFDGVEREFRGFGMVEQWDTEEIGTIQADETFSGDENLDEASFVPPVFTRTWFHTGAYMNGEKISRQFEKEYYREPGLSNEEFEAMLLPDTVLPVNVTLSDSATQPRDLSAQEIREACRTMRGSILRQEVYARDGSEKSEMPYTVSERSYEIKWLQPQGPNRHGVFFVHPGETIDYHYERTLYKLDPNDPDSPELPDPRVSRQLNLEVDVFGNVRKSAAIGYGRRKPDMNLETGDRKKQTQISMTYTENKVTNDIDEPDAYRTPLPYETVSFEVTGLHVAAGKRFSGGDLLTKIAAAAEIGYEESPDDETVQKRLIERERTLYLSDNLSGPLDPGELDAMALPYDSYELAFTPGLLQTVYVDSGKIDAAGLADVLADEGAYIDLDQDGHWWIPSNRVFYSPEGEAESAYARAHFFMPCRFHDPFGNVTTVEYDTHDLLVTRTTDPLDNIATAKNDYRVMQPEMMTDPNGNRSEVAFDALGMVVGTAVMGKIGESKGDSLEDFEADLAQSAIEACTCYPFADPHAVLKKATSRLVYDLTRYQRTRTGENPQPNVVYTLARETHDADLEEDQQTNIQHSFLYSDGFGREIQTKVQAEPGNAPLRLDNSADPDRPGQLVLENGKPKTGGVEKRWVGTGRTVYNNKGKPIKKYEPFFSATHLFEAEPEVTETGVTPILFYDPLERAVATLHPNHTYEKVVFNAWRQETWDVNDTVLMDDPGNDEDVGHFFQRLKDEEYLPTWHGARKDGQLDAAEQAAAEQTEAHADTPSIAYLDNLGRTFLTIADNGLDENGVEQKYETRVEMDIEGKTTFITDDRGNRVMEYVYSVQEPEEDEDEEDEEEDEEEQDNSHLIYQKSMDAGERWTLSNVAGNPIRSWDSRYHQFTFYYDELQRPTRSHVKGVDGDTPLNNVFEEIKYGDWQGMSANDRDQSKANNLIGQPKEHYDAAGVVTNHEYDFKGNLLTSGRQLLRNYIDQVDWSSGPELEDKAFTNSIFYDALNRPVSVTTPDQSITRPTYNEANLLEQVTVDLRVYTEETITEERILVKNIDYDAKGQRELIEYGNGTQTKYTYDPLTYRLTNLKTVKTTNGKKFQDLYYTFDPVGNITEIRDEAQQEIYFNNQHISPNAKYEYDALYRLIKAEGREHPGQTHDCTPDHKPEWKPNYDFNDCKRTKLPLPHPNDGKVMRRYTQHYKYDEVGNILAMIHHANNSGNWKRRYQYRPDNNQLMSTSLPGDPDDLDIPVYSEDYQYSARYEYDDHGNMISMPHLPLMKWDFEDQLQVTSKQVADSGGGTETTYYIYDAEGERVRKITERQNGTRKNERIYLGGFEIYREYKADGIDEEMERETLHIMDDENRIALVETKTRNKGEQVTELTPFIRYQLGNHLGSAGLELDNDAVPISYEEYYPYGSTSYQAVKDITMPPKRYRYTGKERDEETGFNYHSARYYSPWLGRWLSVDPNELRNPSSRQGAYIFSINNPLRFFDPNGETAFDFCNKNPGMCKPETWYLREKARIKFMDDIHNAVKKDLRKCVLAKQSGAYRRNQAIRTRLCWYCVTLSLPLIRAYTGRKSIYGSNYGEIIKNLRQKRLILESLKVEWKREREAGLFRLSDSYKAKIRIKNKRWQRLGSSNVAISSFLSRHKKHLIYASIANYHTFVMRYDENRGKWFRYESSGRRWIDINPEVYFKNMTRRYLNTRYGLRGRGYRANLRIRFGAIRNPDNNKIELKDLFKDKRKRRKR